MKTTKTARIWAFIIDAFIVGLLTSLIQNILPDFFSVHHREIVNIPIKVSFGGSITTYFLYFLIFDLFNNGVSVGKMLLKLIVVESTDEDLDTTKSIIRTVIKLVSLALFPIAALVYLFTNAWTLHEKATNTKTVYLT